MTDHNMVQGERSIKPVTPGTGTIAHTATDLCEKALGDAKGQMHPLLQNSELSRLSQRVEFLEAFKGALEGRIARALAGWQPGVQAIFKYDETRTEDMHAWDGSIHLLVKVPRLSDTVKTWGKKLDRSLVTCLRQLGWERFPAQHPVLEVQQVTPNELRHGIGYGAMFCAVYTAPVKVWPQTGQTG